MGAVAPVGSTKPGVPTPKEFFGYHIGTEKKLTYVADQQRYFRALEQHNAVIVGDSQKLKPGMKLAVPKAMPARSRKIGCCRRKRPKSKRESRRN